MTEGWGGDWADENGSQPDFTENEGKQMTESRPTLREAIAIGVRSEKFTRSGRSSSIDDMDPPTENELLDADAAIAAFRECVMRPSEAMLEAGASELPPTYDEEYLPYVWQAMLTELLKGQDDG
jgi:hypothetical protein